MAKRASAIEVIGYGLAFFYAVGLLTYTNIANIAPFRWYAVTLIWVFGILFVSAIAVALRKEWGRVMIVVTNIILGFVLIIPSYKFIKLEQILPMHYALFFVIFAIVLVLFFTQEKIQRLFRMGKKGGWHSILIIDDDEVYLRTVRTILLSHGYAVLTARTGEHGLQIIRTQKPDLVILDVILPGIKGRELCQQVKKDDMIKHIPILFVTAKDSPEDIQAEKAVGGAMHLGKPFRPKELLASVEQLLSSK
jgi:CheY-like chemotaxis protein